MFYYSKKSLERLKNLHPNLVEFAKELIKISPYDCSITCGMRTAEEQNKLYQQGRTEAGIIVTKCDGYKVQSNHQEKIDGYGYAFDIGVLVKEKIVQKRKIKTTDENGKVVIKEIIQEVEKLVYKGEAKDFHYYQKIYDAAKKAGLIEKYNIEWGGEWKSKDGPHFQIRGAGKIPYKVIYKKEEELI